MLISFYIAETIDHAVQVQNRVKGEILEANELSKIRYKSGHYYLDIEVPATRASELCAELVREGYLD